MTTSIRQAKNWVNIKGEVVTKKVDIKKEDESKINSPVRSVRVDLGIDVGNNNIIPVNLFANRIKANGGENGLYEGIFTIAQQYQARKEDDEGNIIEKGDMVMLSSDDNFQGAQLSVNEFHNKDGVLVQNQQIKGISANRLRPQDEHLPNRAEFQVEGKILTMEKELDPTTGEETGSLIISIASPGYGGRLSILELRTDNPEHVAAMLDLYKVGDTVLFIGDIINSIETKVIKTPMALGGTHEEVVTNVREALVITQAGYPFEEGSELYYTDEQIEAMMAEREMQLQERKERSQYRETNKSSGGSEMAIGGMNAQANKLKKEIPF